MTIDNNNFNIKWIEIVTVIVEILINCQIEIVFIGIVTTLDPMTVLNNSNLEITRGGELFYIPGS